MASQKRRNVHLFRNLRGDPIVACPSTERRPEEIGPSLLADGTGFVAESGAFFGVWASDAGN
jgi:hypothetical protein